MTKVEEYELQRTVFNMVIGTLCFIIEYFIGITFGITITLFLSVLNCLFVSLLIVLSFYICGKRVHKYIEKNSKNISLTDSQL